MDSREEAGAYEMNKRTDTSDFGEQTIKIVEPQGKAVNKIMLDKLSLA